MNLFEGLHCVGIEYKIYTAKEVGEKAAQDGCSSYILSFEHDPDETDQDGLIGMTVEIVSDRITEYMGSFRMWDNRPFYEHLTELHQKALS